MKEPLHHILRPLLPWRSVSDGAITECGYDATKVKTIDRAEFFQRLKDLGQQRTAMMTCMTCSNTTSRWGTWDVDPRLAMEREIQWEVERTRCVRLKDELFAIADLIVAHTDEFLSKIETIRSRREWIEKKAVYSRMAVTRKAADTSS